MEGSKRKTKPRGVTQRQNHWGGREIDKSATDKGCTGLNTQRANWTQVKLMSADRGSQMRQKSTENAESYQNQTRSHCKETLRETKGTKDSSHGGKKEWKLSQRKSWDRLSLPCCVISL